MGIPSEMRDMWVKKRNGFIIASPLEDQNALNARRKLYDQGIKVSFNLFIFFNY